jgi:hypothetical protein
MHFTSFTLLSSSQLVVIHFGLLDIDLRQYDAGMIQTGYRLDGILVPPRQRAYSVVGACAAGCTSQYIPAEGVTVVAAMLHSHLLGTALRTTVIRNGIEYPLVINDAYDFNYQTYDYVTPFFKLLPGDHINTQCVYTSLDRNLTTLGGIETTNEMCLSYIVYYPRMGLTDCESDLALWSALMKFQQIAVDGNITLFHAFALPCFAFRTFFINQMTNIYNRWCQQNHT